jgi:hypothetical protein
MIPKVKELVTLLALVVLVFVGITYVKAATSSQNEITYSTLPITKRIPFKGSHDIIRLKQNIYTYHWLIKDNKKYIVIQFETEFRPFIIEIPLKGDFVI